MVVRIRPITDVNVPRKTNNGIPERVITPKAEARQTVPSAAIEDWRRERWAKRYNATWSRIIAAWSQVLAGGDGKVSALGLEASTGLDAEFQISPIGAWSRPGHDHEYFRRGT